MGRSESVVTGSRLGERLSCLEGSDVADGSLVGEILIQVLLGLATYAGALSLAGRDAAPSSGVVRAWSAVGSFVLIVAAAVLATQTHWLVLAEHGRDYAEVRFRPGDMIILPDDAVVVLLSLRPDTSP
jgi:hypothetical protein